MKHNTKLLIGIVIALVVSCGAFFSIGCGGRKAMVSSESVASTIKSDRPILKVFLENSGSMDGYMCNGSQLKDAVYDYISDLNRSTDTTQLYYINSQIIPYHADLTSYIKDLNPASFRAAGGNTSSTDLGSIINAVLNTVNANTVSIFISDCILDLPSNDAQKFLTNCEIQIKNEVISAQKRVPNLGVEILKLSSDFSGKYFYPNGAVEALDNVKRPYYMWIFGDKDYLAKLNTEVPLSMLERHGLQGIAAFTNLSAVPFDINNHSLQSKVLSSGKDGYQATIRADFRSTLQPNNEVTNIANYSFYTPGVAIKSITPITDKNSKYTHVVNFSIPTNAPIAQDCLTFNVPKMPKWVEVSNDESGSDISKNLSKTTGIKYLIQGVADAYKTETVSAKLKFNIKRQ